MRPAVTATDLARRANLSKQYVSMLEKGADHILTNKPVQPALDKVERLAEVLGVDVNEAREMAGYKPIHSAPMGDEDREYAKILLPVRGWDSKAKKRLADFLQIVVTGMTALQVERSPYWEPFNVDKADQEEVELQRRSG